MNKPLLAATIALCTVATAHAANGQKYDWRIEATVSDITTFDGFAPPSDVVLDAVGMRLVYTIRVSMAADSPHYHGANIYGYTIDMDEANLHLRYQQTDFAEPEYIDVTETNGTPTGFGFRTNYHQFSTPYGPMDAYFRFSNPTGSFSTLQPYLGYDLLNDSFNLTDLKPTLATFGTPNCVDQAYWCGSMKLTVDKLVSTPVPESSSPLMALAGLGLAGAWVARRRALPDRAA